MKQETEISIKNGICGVWSGRVG